MCLIHSGTYLDAHTIVRKLLLIKDLSSLIIILDLDPSLYEMVFTGWFHNKPNFKGTVLISADCYEDWCVYIVLFLE